MSRVLTSCSTADRQCWVAGERSCDETRKSTCDKAWFSEPCVAEGTSLARSCLRGKRHEKRQISRNRGGRVSDYVGGFALPSLPRRSPLLDRTCSRWHVSRSETSRSGGARAGKKQRGHGMRAGAPRVGMGDPWSRPDTGWVRGLPLTSVMCREGPCAGYHPDFFPRACLCLACARRRRCDRVREMGPRLSASPTEGGRAANERGKVRRLTGGKSGPVRRCWEGRGRLVIRHKVREVPRTSQLTRVPARATRRAPAAIYWKPAPEWREAQRGRSVRLPPGLTAPCILEGGWCGNEGCSLGGTEGGGVAMTLVGALHPLDNRHPCESGRSEPGQERSELRSALTGEKYGS